MRLLGFAAVPLLLSASVCLAPSTGLAQLAVSANDGKAYLDNGVAKTVPSAAGHRVDHRPFGDATEARDRDPGAGKRRGPPGQRRGRARRELCPRHRGHEGRSGGRDEAGAGRQAQRHRPEILATESRATLTVGKGAAGVSINKAGTLALVANRSEGTVSVLTISGGKVTEKEKIKLGEANSGPSQPVFTPYGAVALVTRDNDHKISVLSVSGDKVEYTKRDINAGLRPYQIDVTSSGEVAVVANIGLGQGDADTVSVIDLKAKPPRVVNTVTVGQTPEGIKMSPDGRFVAVTVMNGSNKPKDLPFVSDHGLVRIYRLSGKDLTHLTDDKVGHWCQGAAWSKNGRTLLVQCMVGKEIYDFEFDGNGMKKRSTIRVNGGPAGIRTAEP